jgi:hypothetical protein
MRQAGVGPHSKVTKCPPAIPPWPPKPVSGHAKGVVITKRPVAEIHGRRMRKTTQERYDRIRLGMSKDQIRARGITTRDLRGWIRRGLLVFRP